jgi:cation diffusion facilitator family transporter
MDNVSREDQYLAVRRILWGVLVANILITIIKISLGIITGALAIVSDGFHSLVDSSSNLIGLAAIRWAARPADDSHPYGYQRYETLGALAIGGLLLVAAWEIVQSIIERIINGSSPEISWVTFGLMVLTFPVNVGIVIFETRAGKRLKSDILLADATHTKTDLFVTGSVIASIIGIWLGWGWLDLVVASLVVVLILRASIGILRDSAGTLADTAGVDPDQVEKLAYEVPGVVYIHNIRSRGKSDSVFVDLHVKVNPAMSTSQAHALATEVENRLRNGMDNVADAVVHIEPARFEETSQWERISNGLRQIADSMGLGFHDLHVHVNRKGDHEIELDLEIKGDKTLVEAHQLADEYELRIQQYWPPASRVITHLEPISDIVKVPQEKTDENLRIRVETYLRSEINSARILEVQTLNIDNHNRIILTLAMPDDMSLIESHSQVEKIKRDALMHFPEVSRVVVHVEPSRTISFDDLQ